MASKEILLISKKAFCIARTWQKRVKKCFFVVMSIKAKQVISLLLCRIIKVVPNGFYIHILLSANRERKRKM